MSAETETFDQEKQGIEEQDSHISEAGKVGLWTKADSVTAFDDFSWGK